MKRILFLTLCALMVSANVFAEAKLAADAEIDTDYVTETDDAATKKEYTYFRQGGRIQVTVSGKTEAGDLFAEGQTQILAKVNTTDNTNGIGVDDAWVKVGHKMANLQIGRFEGIELFKAGEDVYVAEQTSNATGLGMYKTDAARGRKGEEGALALNVTPMDGLTVQVNTVYGTSGTDNVLAFRPAVEYSMDLLTVALGMETSKTTAQDDDDDDEATLLGYGIKLHVTPMDMIEVGLNFAAKAENGKSGGADLYTDDLETMTYGGFVTVKPMAAVKIGAGFFISEREGGNATTSELSAKTWYVSAQYMFLESTWLKLGVSGTETEEKPQPTGDSLTDDAFGVRLRVCHAF
jgi:hypothetical protein